MINKKPTIKNINDSEMEILNNLSNKQIMLFIDKEYGELLDMSLKNEYSLKDYVRKSDKINQYRKFFTCQEMYKAYAFYKGCALANNRKFVEMMSFKELEDSKDFLSRINGLFMDFSYTCKLLIETLGIVFENVDSDTDLKNNGLLDGYNHIIEELYATACLTKLDIDNLLPIYEVMDLKYLDVPPTVVKELKLEDYVKQFEQYKKICVRFNKVKDDCINIGFPIFDKLSEDGFGSFKEQIESNNPKQKLIYDMKEFRVRIED